MGVGNNRRQTWISWSFVAALTALSLTLGILQYRWIGEVSRAESVRLKTSLQTSLNRLSLEFNADFHSAIRALTLEGPVEDEAERERAYAERYARWRESSSRGQLFRSVSIAVPVNGSLVLKRLRPESGRFEAVDWQPAWSRVRDWMTSRLSGGRPFPGPMGGPPIEDGLGLIEIPHFGHERREKDWLLLELDVDYVRSTIVPDLLQRHLGRSEDIQYDAEILAADDPSVVIYRGKAGSIYRNADASVRLFDPRPGPPRPLEGAGANRGRWTLFVHHRAGSLEKIVESNRRRNIAVTTAILLLLIGSAAALARYTRRAQTVAELQMQFVAGVSHELRTPLTVMRTAGHNLRRGHVLHDGAKVRQYGQLIEEECDKLKALVEQVLRFANAKAGRVIGAREPLSIEAVIHDAVEADRRTIEASGGAIEEDIPSELPAVFGDRNSLKHALQNLIDNAAKYGRAAQPIAVSASSRGGMVEVRIRDHGQGIPPDEIQHIFDPFYRGKKAIQDQIHGTGLGLNLVRRIIEAHEGTITVHSEERKGTEFLVRLPACRTEPELTHSAN